MPHYRILTVTGDELGTGRWNDWFREGDTFHFNGGQRFRVVSVTLFEGEEPGYDGLLRVEPVDA